MSNIRQTLNASGSCNVAEYNQSVEQHYEDKHQESNHNISLRLVDKIYILIEGSQW